MCTLRYIPSTTIRNIKIRRSTKLYTLTFPLESYIFALSSLFASRFLHLGAIPTTYRSFSQYLKSALKYPQKQTGRCRIGRPRPLSSCETIILAECRNVRHHESKYSRPSGHPLTPPSWKLSGLKWFQGCLVHSFPGNTCTSSRLRHRQQMNQP